MLNKEVKFIKGVGPKRARLLNKLGIYSLEDLLLYMPREYEDRSRISLLREVREGEKATFKLKVVGQPLLNRPRKNMAILKVPVTDGYNMAYLSFFNQEFLRSRFKKGKIFLVYGTKKSFARELIINNPKFEEDYEGNEFNRIHPLYNLTEGLTNNALSKIIKNALDDNFREIYDFLPFYIIDRYKMMDRYRAIRNMHFPDSEDTYIRARNRMVFEELLLLHLGLNIIKRKKTLNSGFTKIPDNNLAYDFQKTLPFELTGAQKKVFEEIKEDMNSEKQMNRLVQGDVGSGKTLVAIMAMLYAIGGGYQTAMMAPTEILGSQHYKSIKTYLEGFNIRVELLVSSLKDRDKKQILEDLKEGKIDILVGTHALIQEGVEFKNLGLVITDEQHRFGVKQRAALSEKGENPDTLVMTATPIPRTLALILYGDLDISIIDELPPGRKEIATYAVNPNMIDRINLFIRKNIDSGRQAYIVCPLIEENENLNIRSAEEVYEDLSNNFFRDYKVGLLHGKMKNEEKDRVMDEFKRADVDILVSTTVIEVGVDVPNSNIMVIYNAERFGLAQLHQLRGRVGRGEHQSYCILINEGDNYIARERMRVMESSSDGFIISEKDLELRGPGEFFGTRQHGIPELKIANLFKDMAVLKLAEKEAKAILEDDFYLEKKEHLGLKYTVMEKFKDVEDISFN